MIDEKKIKDAAKVVVEKEYTKDIPIIKNTFKNGFHKGIDWFLDNLWHPAREEPKIPNGEIYVSCLVKYKNKSTELCTYWLTDGWACNTMCHRAFMENFDSWLYINDLLKEQVLWKK